MKLKLKIMMMRINLIKYFLFNFLSTFAFFLYLWFTLIRDKLPKEIPYTLDSIIIILLLLLLLIHIITVTKKIFKFKNFNKMFWQKYIENVFSIPIISFLNYLKVNKIKTFALILKLLNYLRSSSYIKIYTFSYAIVRVCCAATLLLEIFYFHKIFRFYTLITILIIINVLNTLNKIGQQWQKDDGLYEISTKYVIYPLNIKEHIREVAPGITELKSMNIDRFVEYQSVRVRLKRSELPYSLGMNEDYVESFTLEEMKKLNFKLFTENGKRILNDSIYANLFLLDLQQEKFKYEWIDFIISFTYIICWSYVLIISLSTFPNDAFIYAININAVDPFSEISLN